MMTTNVRASVAGFALVAAWYAGGVSPACAGVNVRGEAERAVRELLERELPKMSRVRFISTRDTLLSPSEARVVGDGNVSRSRDPRREFSFSAKVARSDGRVRDIEVRFRDGQVIRGTGDGYGRDDRRRRTDEYANLAITYPGRHQTLRQTDVEISGVARRGDVRLRIYDGRNRQIAERRSAVWGGRWSVRMSLTRGAYRVRAEADGGRAMDELSFYVEPGGGGYGGSDRRYEAQLRIESPASNGRVRGQRFDIRGVASGSGVRIEVYDQRNRRVAETRAAVRGDRWSATLDLPGGRYRAVARMDDGRLEDQVEFIVEAPQGRF